MQLYYLFEYRSSTRFSQTFVVNTKCSRNITLWAAVFYQPIIIAPTNAIEQIGADFNVRGVILLVFANAVASKIKERKQPWRQWMHRH